MSAVEKSSTSALTLAAIGVVFGDIGTSPLYAIKESFHATHGLPIIPENVMGILSIIFWAIALMVTLKYVLFIMRAHNHGEGGIMALLSLSLRTPVQNRHRFKLFLIGIGLFGAALFFGDGIITPAISVLGAMEGLKVVSPQLEQFVVPIALGVLTFLFVIQQKGTGTMGKLFGPITLLWFLSIGIFGVMGIASNPEILGLINPLYAIQFVMAHPAISFFLLGAVVLAITGGEALYADMGHFGRKPIVLGWFLVVLPCLVLNYAGQGALLLDNPEAISNPFYLLIPKPLLYPMIFLATLAAIIASQAVISGVFSVARQAMQLGYLPRMTVLHTSVSEKGQIYIPFLNWLLFGSVIGLVLLFKTSSNLAAAYGIAVTLTMMCDTILVAVVMYYLWHWGVVKTALFAVPFLILDLLFFGATATKVLDGGWVPLLIGFSVFGLMVTWKQGRDLLFKTLQRDTMPLSLFIKSMGNSAHLVPGTAVFMTSTFDHVPHALLHNLKHNKVIHKTNLIVTVVIQDVPFVSDEQRFERQDINSQFMTIKLFFGFKQVPNVPEALAVALADSGVVYNEMTFSYFVSRERLVSTKVGGMSQWREKIFISMSKNTSSASDFFMIPSSRVLEIGSQVEI